MALYSYQAFTKAGKKVSGSVDAQTLAGARDQLIKMNLYPIKIVAAAQEVTTGFNLSAVFVRSVPLKTKILFTKQLAILLRSGVPMLEAFDLLIEQFDGKMRSMLISIKDGLREGQSLAQGLSKYPKVFDNIFIQLVRAGEATGRLEVILERLTVYLERRQEINARIQKAMTYPMIQLGVIAVVVTFLMTVVVPQMAENFKRSGKMLPTPTRIVLGISSFMRSYYLVVIILIILLIIAYRAWKATPNGAKTIDRLKLKIPIVQFFTRMGAVVQFSRTLGMLIEGGVNLADALDIVCNIIDNRVLADSLQQARENIIKQGKITQYLKQTGVFPPVAIYLIKTGEETGKLDVMLLTVAQNYETELNEYADGLSSAIDPIMLLIMGVIVGFIVLSVGMPLMQQATLAG
jgi:type II secretory pathway component PulF